MKTYTITLADVDKGEGRENRYIGKTDLSDFRGDIAAEPGLGLVSFDKPLMAEGDITFHRGSGIVAAATVRAKGTIDVDAALVSRQNIYAGRGLFADVLYARYGIESGRDIYVPRDSAITAGFDIRAAGDIVGGKIAAAFGIVAGGQVRADEFIRSMGGDIVGAQGIKCRDEITASRGNLLSGSGISGERLKGRLILAARSAFARRVEGMIEVGPGVRRLDELKDALRRVEDMRAAQASFLAPAVKKPRW